MVKNPSSKNIFRLAAFFCRTGNVKLQEKTCETGNVIRGLFVITVDITKDKRQKYFRMMDLMEQNIRRKVSDFKLDQCISSYKITQNLKLKKLGFGGMILPFATYTDLKMSRYATY